MRALLRVVCAGRAAALREAMQKEAWDQWGRDIPQFKEFWEFLNGLAKGYVNLLADGKRMTEIGFDRWIDEQEARKAAGFCYADIHCQPYEVPDR